MRTGKHLRCVALCLSMVLLLLFGGHVGVACCACSGDVSLLIFNNEQCCAGDEDCMQIMVVETDDYVPCAVVSLDAPMATDALCSYPDYCPAPFTTITSHFPQDASVPPDQCGDFSMVMRV